MNVYGLFYANATFLSQNFHTQAIGTGAPQQLPPHEDVATADELSRLHPRVLGPITATDLLFASI
jgi:hypothetical protein